MKRAMLRKRKGVLLVFWFGALGSACSAGDGDGGGAGKAPPFELTSPAFQAGQDLPLEYTCAGKSFPFSGFPPVDHTLPELTWTPGPANTKSYAVVFKDVTLTTGTPVNELGYHWAIWNIPASVRSLPRALASGNPVTAVPGAKQYSGPLFNDGYVGPCPSWAVAPGAPPMEPPAMVSTDHYTFTVYALESETFDEPAMRSAPAEGAPPISYVRDLDESLTAIAIGKASLAATSNAQPAMFATP